MSTGPRKIVLFVEGYSEMYLLEKFVREWLGPGNVNITTLIAADSRYTPQIRYVSGMNHASTWVTIVNCGGESKIASYVRNSIDSYKSKGFTKAIVLCDVHPRPIEDCAEYKTEIESLLVGVGGLYTKIVVIISIHEIDAVFFLDDECISKYCDRDMSSYVDSELGSGWRLKPVSEISSPASRLTRIARKVDCDYSKKQEESEKLVAGLDIDKIVASPVAWCTVVELSNEL